MEPNYHLTMMSLNNHFGQHHFRIETNDPKSTVEKIEKIVWFKKPKILTSDNAVEIFCFNNYDKAAVEREFGNE